MKFLMLVCVEPDDAETTRKAARMTGAFPGWTT